MSCQASKWSFVGKMEGSKYGLRAVLWGGFATSEPTVNLCPQMRKMKGCVTGARSLIKSRPTQWFVLPHPSCELLLSSSGHRLPKPFITACCFSGMCFPSECWIEIIFSDGQFLRRLLETLFNEIIFLIPLYPQGTDKQLFSPPGSLWSLEPLSQICTQHPSGALACPDSVREICGSVQHTDA